MLLPLPGLTRLMPFLRVLVSWSWTLVFWHRLSGMRIFNSLLNLRILIQKVSKLLQGIKIFSTRTKPFCPAKLYIDLGNRKFNGHRHNSPKVGDIP